ncbi:MAG: DUF3015 family protein [Proteobacteria bacterium]|nr:DUF3015 family protein [Pseudomonadota bacterium]
MKLPQLLPLIFGLSMPLAASAFAQARPYGMAGCGLGSIVMGPAGNQVLAGTTNSATYSGGIGISSGTSNCKTTSEMAVIARQQEFLAANLSTLQKEMAQGSGTSVRAFVEVLGCGQNVEDRAQEKLIKNYSLIFSAVGIEGVLETVKQEFSKDQRLLESCQYLG